MSSIRFQGSRRSVMDSGIGIDIGGFSLLSDNTLPSNYSHDPLLLQGRHSPIELKYDPDSVAAIDFTSPAKMYMEDSLNGNITPFMDAVPDILMESMNHSNMSSPYLVEDVPNLHRSTTSSPSSLVGDVNPLEVFQDLQHTSTPIQLLIKQEYGGCSQARKRIKFSDGTTRQSRSWHVLHDITSNNVLPERSESFVKISDSFSLCQAKKIEHVIKKPVTEKPLIHKVPILRGNTRRKPDLSSVSCIESTRQSPVTEFLFLDRNPSVREMDKWLYYTGFTNYDLMLRVLSHISVPSIEGLSSFQILIMTLMRIKCDLDWKDLGYRFHVFEPTVYSLFHSTLSLLSYSLSDVIPWTLPPHERSNVNITVFLYPLSFRSGDAIKNIFVFLTDSRCPILYVSDPRPSTYKALSLLPSLSRYFNTDDQVCVKGLSYIKQPTFFRIVKNSENAINCKYVEAKNSVAKAKFIKSCDGTIKALKQYKLLLSKIPFTDDAMRQIVSVVCSLINIRTSEHISEASLKNIYKRSYRVPYTTYR